MQGVKPDPAKALDWYKKAQLSGSRDAAVEIQRLESGPALP
ncbi:MAG: SEL1-like repeat protein [Rhizobiales bacterium]|nr:SEL1-like repeat protein [Hyphomicrobiales bacterium]